MSWNTNSAHQDLSASGSYSANSALAKEYAGLEEDGSSRVDDGEGWREIKRDNPPKTAAEYEEFVKKWSAAGFDVKAIDMNGDDFTHSNIAVKPKEGGGTPEKKGPVAVSPELAHAKARVQQRMEDVFSGKYTADLYDMNYRPDTPGQTFADRYKSKLGTKTKDGLYVMDAFQNALDEGTNKDALKTSSVGGTKNALDSAHYARTGSDNRF